MLNFCRSGLFLLTVAGLALGSGVAAAQEGNAPATSPLPIPPAVVTSEEDLLLGEEELDALVGPIALYPDGLLAQVLVAATYPLDIVKADRWVEENKALEGTARTEAAEAEGWDESVAILAAGFPDVVHDMASDLDQTELLGDALLAQSDDVLDAIQRMRARAAALGNLESNEAQQVTTEDDTISIAPAEPEVVYVPSYDTTVYTAPASAPAVVVAPEDDGFSTGELIATGAIAFATGMLVNEIFDDDDDWHGYWWDDDYRHNHHFDWDDNYFYPRPGWGGGNFSGNDIDIDIGEVNIDRNRVDIDRDRLDINRDGAWRPDSERQNDARDKIAERWGPGAVAARPAIADRRDGAGGDRAALKNKINARTEGGGQALARPADAKPPKRKEPKKASAFTKPSNAGLSKTRQAEKRGKLSTNKARAQVRPKAQINRNLSRPNAAKPIAKRSSRKATAFNQGGNRRHAGGGGRAHQAKARGGRSAGRRRNR